MSRSLVLLSGEGTTIPEAEAKALFLAYDPHSKFRSPEKRVLIVDSVADPFVVGRRIAFSRRVGRMIDTAADVAAEVSGKQVRLLRFNLGGKPAGFDPAAIMRGLNAEVDLRHPDFEISLIHGRSGEYLALTRPEEMNQAWVTRRPRARPFFHPSAIFPKLARALVNLSRFKEGETFLDPFCGTGSLAIEAFEAGAKVIVSDEAERMVRGSLMNMKHFGQNWLGVIRADAFYNPVMHVDAIATDVPYGRASSTRGNRPSAVLKKTMQTLPSLLRAGSRMVIMHSKMQKIEDSGEATVEDEHDLYVHKLLTRTITILRRK